MSGVLGGGAGVSKRPAVQLPVVPSCRAAPCTHAWHVTLPCRPSPHARHAACLQRTHALVHSTQPGLLMLGRPRCCAYAPRGAARWRHAQPRCWQRAFQIPALPRPRHCSRSAQPRRTSTRPRSGAVRRSTLSAPRSPVTTARRASHGSTRTLPSAASGPKSLRQSTTQPGAAQRLTHAAAKRG